MTYRLYQMVVADETLLLGATIEVALPEVLEGTNPTELREWAIRNRELRVLVEVSGPGLATRLPLSQILLGFYGRTVLGGEMTTADFYQKGPFFDYLSREMIVPFERSPLGGESLDTLALSGVAALVELKRIAGDPLLWIESAGALTLVGIIRKVGTAVGDVGQDAVRYHLPRLLRLPGRPGGRPPRHKA